MAGATLCASSPTFAWQVQHFDSQGVACAFAWQTQHFASHATCLQAQHVVHLALFLRGRCSSGTLWQLPVRVESPRGTGCFCVAGTALSACNATLVWQVLFLLLALHGIQPSRVTLKVADSHCSRPENKNKAKTPTTTRATPIPPASQPE